MNERAVREAFRTAIDRYCNLANASGLRTKGLRVSISVATVDTLTRDTVGWINQLAHDQVFQMLPGAVVGSIAFPQEAGLPEPGHRFTFHPPALPAPRATVPYPEVAVTLPPPQPIAVLTLRYDADFVWPCRIGAAEHWMALGRWTGRPVADPAAMRLPTYATWLPRGRLLLVRNHRGHFAFGRSGNRPQYEIRVDGAALHPGGSVTARAEGEIVYRFDRSSTLLTYRVEWEGHHAG